MFKEFTRGQLSKLFNINAETLRYYADIGLLKPDINPHNGYSIYGLEHVFLLSSILRSRYLDISIADIKNLQNEWTLDSYEDFINKELAEIKRRKAHLNEIEKLMKKSKMLLKEMTSFKNNFDFEKINKINLKKNFYIFKLNDVLTAIIKNKGFVDVNERENVYINVSFKNHNIFYDSEHIFVERDTSDEKFLKYLTDNITYETRSFEGNLLKEKFLGTIPEIKSYIKDIMDFYSLDASNAFLSKLSYVPVDELYFVEILIKLNN
ncbi:MerR family transcriptional regulator [uncultured Clostridium sp.]|jgi:DNA-binding transcriptional MerR regulator|uniref:MerR family transcriptional regulator n=1 Tax=uncultured Clostridium sp. TaxID=59620 RepID=UPI002623BD1C|nr:MerR family transcriptional regulator [uncultured Clostridium sp.]